MAQNEVLFREVNERISEMAAQLGGDAPYDFLCECANADCTFRITLVAADYEAVRADPTQFLVLPDHFTPEVENLIARHDSHWVVRKTGEAGEYVESLDPRSP